MLVERVTGALGANRALRRVGQLPSDAVKAVAELTQSAIDRVLISPDHVRSAGELRERLEHLADQTTMTSGALATGAVGLVTRLGKRFPLKRVPSAVAITGSLAVGASIRAGVLELRALASYLVHRCGEANVPVDARTIERATLLLYLNPARPSPSMSAGRGGTAPAKLLWLWVRRAGVLPLTGRKKEERRIENLVEAFEKLDLSELARR